MNKTLYFEVDKQQVKSKKTAFVMARKYAKEHGYSSEPIESYNNYENDWQHPDRLKNKWVFVMEKGANYYRLCPHGKGFHYRGTSLVPNCYLCRKLEEAMLKKWVDNFLKAIKRSRERI